MVICYSVTACNSLTLSRQLIKIRYYLVLISLPTFYSLHSLDQVYYIILDLNGQSKFLNTMSIIGFLSMEFQYLFICKYLWHTVEYAEVYLCVFDAYNFFISVSMITFSLY